MNERELSFRNWISGLKSDQYIIEETDRGFILRTEYAHALVLFNEIGIIEYQIINESNDKTEFYLHFQLHDEEHAKDLFFQLVECLIQVRPREKTKVLLTCSSALTTSYYSEKLNETAELLNVPYEFYAAAAGILKEKAEQFRIILLAPQVAFRKNEIVSWFPDKKVIEIPGRMFGTYDVQGILNLVENTLSPKKPEKELIFESDRKVMAVSTRIDRQFKISWRVYHRGEIIRTETVIKDRIDIRDFEDILDTVSIYEKDIDTVVISMPGIVRNGTVSLNLPEFRNFAMRDHLSERYPYRFVITNNANATALGLYYMQKKYSSIVYHSQLAHSRRGGQGIVIGGNVISGKNGIAGEINCLLKSGEEEERCTPEETLIRCAEAILSDIAVIGPDAVYIRCNIIHDVKKIREYLMQRVEEHYIPDLILIPHSGEYMYFGAQIMAGEEYGLI